MRWTIVGFSALGLTTSGGSYVGPLVGSAACCLVSAAIYLFWVRIKPVVPARQTVQEPAA